MDDASSTSRRWRTDSANCMCRTGRGDGEEGGSAQHQKPGEGSILGTDCCNERPSTTPHCRIKSNALLRNSSSSEQGILSSSLISTTAPLASPKVQRACTKKHLHEFPLWSPDL
ncbi:unnamed protein product [Pleuronectes platessa]|uniref:Uncharacterized protein n=1 Tax=Pleuronectes platessa TaxID=8262 RepID=A0A9N7VEU8_PLEPL|nr:unnamed protein product [Pleuronectes platessa]